MRAPTGALYLGSALSLRFLFLPQLLPLISSFPPSGEPLPVVSLPLSCPRLHLSLFLFPSFSLSISASLFFSFLNGGQRRSMRMAAHKCAHAGGVEPEGTEVARASSARCETPPLVAVDYAWGSRGGTAVKHHSPATPIMGSWSQQTYLSSLFKIVLSVSDESTRIVSTHFRAKKLCKWIRAEPYLEVMITNSHL